MGGELAPRHPDVELWVERRAFDSDETVQVGHPGRSYGKRHLFPRVVRPAGQVESARAVFSRQATKVAPRQRSRRLRGDKLRR
jgi:hypothetical protein